MCGRGVDCAHRFNDRTARRASSVGTILDVLSNPPHNMLIFVVKIRRLIQTRSTVDLYRSHLLFAHKAMQSYVIIQVNLDSHSCVVLQGSFRKQLFNMQIAEFC